ncbi:s-protein like protein 2 [Quercus suber]|uniref:S-protein homolog n=1 Tax=Quercus suber TaxID=58331 RepID=A0AAW0LDY8_QUESU
MKNNLNTKDTKTKTYINEVVLTVYSWEFEIIVNYVRIINDLGNIELVFHCKSKDDDLGLRGVKPAAYWEFFSRQNVFASTLFFCNFWYTNFDKITFRAAFVVFKSDFEFVKECGGDSCMWIARVDGLYKYNLQTKMAVKKYDWQRAVMNDDLLDFAGIKGVLSLTGIKDLLSFVGIKDLLGFAS